MTVYIDELRDGFNSRDHLVMRNAVILEREGDIFADRLPDELAVRVLKNGPDLFGSVINDGVVRDRSGYFDRSADLAFVIVRNQAVDAMSQRAFSAPGRPKDQDFFTGVNFQVNIG